MNRMTGGCETVRVALDARSYDIVVGTGLCAEAGPRLRQVMPGAGAVLITDHHVGPLYLDAVSESLAAADIAHSVITLPAGEGTKDFSHLEKLLDDILAARPGRDVTLVALGGGVIGDLVGFAASILLRGVAFVQIPTTLLAQVDSSVGGKTGINTRHGKNLVGSFYQPRLVLADIETLATLPARQFMAGYAETLKYALIDDPDFFRWLETHGAALVAGDRALRRQAVTHCCRAKARVVAEDERESGRRALLNLGHTFGHALEAEAGFGDGLLHGEAVAIGMIMAMAISVRLGLCPAADLERLQRHYRETGLPMTVPANLGASWTADALLAHMAHDKKVKDGRLTFVLSRGIGKAFLSRDVAEADILAVLAESLPA